MKKSMLAVNLLVTSAGLAGEPTSEQVVITGTRTQHLSWDSPIQTEIIVLDDQKSQHYRNLGELLATVPSLEVTSSIRGSAIRLNGLDPKFTLILIDGQRLPGKFNETYDLQRLDLSNVQRIEIIRGAGSALYGSDALGGVINIITHDRVRTKVQVHADSLGEKDLTVGTGASIGDLALPIEAYLQDARPLQLGGGEATTFSGIEKRGLSFHPNYRGEDWTLRGRVQTSVEKLDSTEIAVGGSVQKRNNELRNTLVGLEAGQRFENDSELKATVQGERYQDILIRSYRFNSEQISREKTLEDNVEVGLQFSQPLPSQLLTVGGQFVTEKLEADRLDQSAVERERSALFLQDEITLGSQWSLVPAVRYDHDTQFEEHVSKKLALKFAPDMSQNVRLSYGEGYRAPGFRELYLLFENNSVGYIVEGNPDLTPEKSQSVHAQYEKRWTSNSISLDAFHTRVDDLIQDIVLSSGGPAMARYTYANIGKAETAGTDLAFNTRAWDGFKLSLRYGFLQARNLSEGIPLPGRSKHSLGYQWSYDWAKLTLQQSLKWQSSRTPGEDASLDNDTAVMSGDISLGLRPTREWLLSLAVENLPGSSGDLYWSVRPRSVGVSVAWYPENPI